MYFDGQQRLGRHSTSRINGNVQKINRIVRAERQRAIDQIVVWNKFELV